MVRDSLLNTPPISILHEWSTIGANSLEIHNKNQKMDPQEWGIGWVIYDKHFNVLLFSKLKGASI